MKKIVEFDLADGGTALVEVDERSVVSGMGPASRDGDTVVEKARHTLDGAISSLRPALAAIVRSIRDLEPDELEVSLGVKLTVGTNAVIAATSTDANLGIKLVWKKEPPSASDK